MCAKQALTHPPTPLLASLSLSHAHIHTRSGLQAWLTKASNAQQAAQARARGGNRNSAQQQQQQQQQQQPKSKDEKRESDSGQEERRLILSPRNLTHFHTSSTYGSIRIHSTLYIHAGLQRSSSSSSSSSRSSQGLFSTGLSPKAHEPSWKYGKAAILFTTIYLLNFFPFESPPRLPPRGTWVALPPFRTH